MTDYANGSTERINLKLYLSGTGTDATGKTVAVTISKNGAAFGNPSAGATNATEIGNGWYYFAPSATDTGTNGPLVVRGTATACDNSEALHAVVPAPAGRLTGFTFTGSFVKADLVAIEGDATAADRFYDTLSLYGTVNDAAATTTSFITDLSLPFDNLIDRQILISSGGDRYAIRTITDFNEGTGLITVDKALRTAPSTGDTFMILAIASSGNTAADALLDRVNGIETGITLRQANRAMLAESAGKLSGGATTTNTFRNAIDTKNRIVATVDADGNRTAITLDLT